jgi:hypothetical protein
MASVKELFAMTNEALLEAWHKAKLDDLEWRLLIRMTKAAADDAEHREIENARITEERKLETEIIRLVISFRLMGREISKPPEA